MRRHAGVGVAGLIAKRSLQKMLAGLRCKVRMQNELTRIHAEFVVRSNLQRELGTRREIHSCDVKTRSFEDGQPRRNQRLLQGRMRVDMQTIGYAEVKIDLHWMARRHGYPFGVEELDRRGHFVSRVGIPGQR